MKDLTCLDIWRRIFQQSLNVLNALFLEWLCMLPFKIIFQGLDGLSAIYMDKFYDFTASDLWQLSIKRTCQETDLITFCSFFCVNLYKIQQI